MFQDLRASEFCAVISLLLAVWTALPVKSGNMTFGKDDFEQVLETCHRFLLRLACKEVPDHLLAKGGASDLVQQTFVTAIQRQHQFRGATLAELRGWLRSILRTEAALFRRKFNETEARDVTREVLMKSLTDPGQLPPQILSDKTEDRIRVGSAFAGLSETTQRVISLRMEQGMTFAEIGKVMNRSEDAARKLFASAIDKMRNTLRLKQDDQ